jgi:peptide/nickel transport system permease protein
MIKRIYTNLLPFLRMPQFTVSIIILLLIGSLALFAPAVSQWDPWRVNGQKRFAPPSATHWLGCDEFGRDIFSNIAYGARISLGVSISSMLFSSMVGIILGMTAGYFRGWWESISMRGIDVLLCFPPMLMAIFLVSLTGPSVPNLIFVIGVLYIPRFTRIAYSSTLSVSEILYIESSRAIGAPASVILFKHILPNILAPLFVQFSLGLGAAILIESGLSFLGLGPPPPTPSWGRMISKARRFLELSPYGVLWASIIISMTVVAFNLMGDALRDRLDPRLRGKL